MNEAPPRVAAFFDFDRTVVDADGGVLFGRELLRIRRRRISEPGRGTLGWLGRVLAHHARFAYWLLLATGARLLYHLKVLKRSALVDLAYTALRGWSADDLRLLARDFVAEVLIHRAYPEALARIRWHHEQGHLVIIATTNMRILVENLKQHAPVDDVIGVDLVTQNGITTGRARGPRYGVEKAQAIRNYAHARNISLPRSYAYTDHFSDHFILSLTGHPFAVNPGRRLRRMAQRHRWGILAWREPRQGTTGPVHAPTAGRNDP